MITLAIAAAVLAPQPPKTSARVLVFVLEDCPIARKYMPELKRIGTDFGTRGVEFEMVHVDPHTTKESAATFQREFNVYWSPPRLDTGQKLARQYGVTHVPSVVVLDSIEVKYVGRIDDRFPRLGVERKAPTRRDLRITLEAVLKRKPVRVSRTQAVGCLLPTL